MANDPQGWTSTIRAKDKIKSMLKASTEIPVDDVKLQEIAGTQYVFQSGDDYYFWNAANEEGGRVTFPTNYNDLTRQMDADITQVHIRMLED